MTDNKSAYDFLYGIRSWNVVSRVLDHRLNPRGQVQEE